MSLRGFQYTLNERSDCRNSWIVTSHITNVKVIDIKSNKLLMFHVCSRTLPSNNLYLLSFEALLKDGILKMIPTRSLLEVTRPATRVSWVSYTDRTGIWSNATSKHRHASANTLAISEVIISLVLILELYLKIVALFCQTCGRPVRE